MRKILSRSNAILIGSAATKHWFPSFRSPHDYDIYAMRDYLDTFQSNPNVVLKNRSKELFHFTIDDIGVDITIDKGDNGIKELIEANYGSDLKELFGSKLLIAKPTTLMLIKKIFYRTMRGKRLKNKRDYNYLIRATYESPTEYELKAIAKREEYLKRLAAHEASRKTKIQVPSAAEQ